MELERLQKKLGELESASTEIANSNLPENTKRVALESMRKEIFEIRTEIYTIKASEQEHTAYMETHHGNKR